jgi:dTDP-4-dehydrorhamnose reductase
MLINIASGAEFDIDTDIDQVKEEEIWNRNPHHSYGSSKNLIARSAVGIPNFYNLRLFGCFDSSESNARLIKRVQNQLSQHKIFYVANDRKFDMVSAVDFATVVSAVIDNKITDKDLNVVYQNKHKLSEILKMFARIHGYNDNLISVSTTNLNNYTGNGFKLSKYQLPLHGLETSFKHYGCSTDDGIEPVRF